MTARFTHHYHARFQRVLAHIEDHLDGDLSVDVLSGVAAFSRFHFHRQFSALFGIGVHRFVQLARLKRATYKLAFRDRETILQIALDSGYEGPEAFARAFKQSVGTPPHRWLLLQRVLRAKSLLRDADRPLADIAIACGFADQSHFTRVFTHIVGTSPGAWRKQVL